MKAVVEPLEGNKVKLSIEVDEQEFEKAIDAAFRKIAREVRIPGFGPGKAPRRILEARLGKETGQEEALRDALPDYYSQALREHDVDAIAAPEIDITAGEESGPVAFDAVVEVRPQLQLAGYGGLRVEIPSPMVTEEDIDTQVDRLRGNFGELTKIARPARDGDLLTIDLKGTRDGERCAGLDDRRLLLRARQRHRPARAGRASCRGPGRRHLEVQRRAPGRAGRLPGPGQGGQGEGPSRRHRRVGLAKRRSSTPWRSCATTFESGSAR